MKKSKIIVLLICSHLLVAALSLGGAYYLLKNDARNVINEANNMLNDMALVSRYAAYASMQQVHGYPDKYKEALKLYSNALDYSKKLNSPMFSENSYQTDKMLISVNLSKIQRENGNIKEANMLLEKAIEHCKNTKMKSCSTERILHLSKIMDENNMFATTGKPNKSQERTE